MAPPLPSSSGITRHGIQNWALAARFLFAGRGFLGDAIEFPTTVHKAGACDRSWCSGRLSMSRTTGNVPKFYEREWLRVGTPLRGRSVRGRRNGIGMERFICQVEHQNSRTLLFNNCPL